MAFRILAIFILFFSVLFMPFYVSAILLIGFMAYFPMFFEGVIIFFISDLLYGAPEVKFYGITYVSLLGSTLILLVAEFLKKKLTYYPKY